jgi:hypothetical protein
MEVRVATERVAVKDANEKTANTSAVVWPEPADPGTRIGALQRNDGHRFTSGFQDPTSPRPSNIFLPDDDPELDDCDDEDEPTDDDDDLHL